MKRTSFGILSIFFALFTVVTCLNSCEVTHFYTAEVTVVDNNGFPMSGVNVSTNVDVNAPHVVYKEAVTNGLGKASFEFNNVAILKVSADKDNYHGEGLLVLEEDVDVKLTVVVYN